MSAQALTSTALIAFVISLLSIRLILPLAKRFGLVDHPDERKVHDGAIPLIGGVSAFISYSIVTLFVLPESTKLTYLVLGAAIVLVVGALDDYRPISVRIRLFLQVIACGLVIWGTGLSVDTLSNIEPLGNIELGFMAVPFTVIAVIGLMNAFNFIDGIDGLSGVIALVAIVGILAFESLSGSSKNLEYLAFLGVSLLPYLLHNLGFLKGKIFLGDAGSMFVGFTIAWTLINQTQVGVQTMSSSAVLWCVAVPVIDTLGVMVRRIKKGHSPFKPDRDHLHHILLRAGFSSCGALIIITGFALSVLAFGMVVEQLFPAYSLYFFVIVVCLYVYGLLHAWKLQRALKR